MTTTEALSITIPEDKIYKARKWMHAKLELQLPEGWSLDYSWGRDHPEPVVSSDYHGRLVVGIRKLVDKEE